MKNGRIKDTIKARAVWKKVKRCCQEVQHKAVEDLQTVQLSFSEGDSDISVVSDTISVPIRLLKEGRNDYIKVQFDDILNRLYADNADPITMTVIIILPEQTEEVCLRFLMDCLMETASKEQIEISDVKAECCSDVSHALLMITVLGKRKQNLRCLHGLEDFLPGKEIVMVGAAGLEGTIMLENAGRVCLQQRFSKQFLKNVRDLSSKTQICNTISLVREIEEDAGVYCIGRTGVFGALWEMASILKKGFLVELLEIPVYQETIEICEFFDVSPYRLRSGGALLVAMNHGRTLVDKCTSLEIPAAIIGSIRDNADKLVCNGEERRYLDMPSAVKIGRNAPEDLNWIY